MGPRPRVTEFELLLLGLLSLGLLAFFKFFLSSHTEGLSSSSKSQIVTHPQAPRISQTVILDNVSPRKSAVTPEQHVTKSNAIDSNAVGMTSETVSPPLVFAGPLPDHAMLEEEVTEFIFMKQRFVDLVGGPGQDPNDPQYFERWEQAQKQVDDELRAYLGSEAFDQEQLQALRASN